MMEERGDEEGEPAVEQVTNKRKHLMEEDSNAGNAKERTDHQIANQREDVEGEEQPKEAAVEQVTNKRKHPMEEDSNAGNAKKRKDRHIANKAKKSAEIKSINSVANKIFDKTRPVSNYAQLEHELVSAKRELRCTNLKLATSEAKNATLEDEIIEQEASLTLIIEYLQKKVTGLEAENRALRAKCNTSSVTTAISTGKYSLN